MFMCFSGPFAMHSINTEISEGVATAIKSFFPLFSYIQIILKMSNSFWKYLTLKGIILHVDHSFGYTLYKNVREKEQCFLICLVLGILVFFLGVPTELKKTSFDVFCISWFPSSSLCHIPAAAAKRRLSPLWLLRAALPRPWKEGCEAYKPGLSAL